MPEVTEVTTKAEAEKVESSDSAQPVANGASENGVSSTSPEKKSPEKNEGEVLLAQGKRHLFVKDYPNAVAVLGDACAKLAEMYSDLADECADAYFCYGRALLELAREESNVLGNGPEKEDSEEGDEEEGDDEGEETQEGEDGEAEAKTDDSKEESKVEGNANEDKKGDLPADETIDTTREVNEDSEETTGEEKEEDVDNLQLAWEVLELAKKIFERQKADVRLAETYFYLGEVGLESENYSGAIDDMNHCVEIQKRILPPDHRDIAETYFQLGVACSLSNEFDEAIKNFKNSSELLETRIKNLQTNGVPADIDTEKNPFYSVEKEISEIKELLPEIKAKIADMEDFKQETLKRVMETMKERQESNDGAGPSSSDSFPVANGSPAKPVTNISHLVRKKRKPEEEESNEASAKKACTSEATKTS